MTPSVHSWMAARLFWLATIGSVAASDAAAQGRLVVDTIEARTLVGNRAGDPTAREIYTYLPPSYDRDGARRYPVLYLLHGMTSLPREWVDGTYQGFDLRVTMDSLARARGVEFVVVMPDADNAFGGTFYVDSPAFGRWDRFIARELVAFIDRRYRTRTDRRHRAIAGLSMGGFGALSVAQGHPDTFSGVYAMSPCCLDLVGDLAPEGAVWRWAVRGATVTRAQGGRARIVRTMAAAFAKADELRPADPDGGASGTTLAAPLPFAHDSTGGVRTDSTVVNAWHRFLPVSRLSRDPGPFRSLCAVALDFGTFDEIASVTAGSRAFSSTLTRAGVDHTIDEFNGGHVDRTRERFERHVLPFFAALFDERGARPRC